MLTVNHAKLLTVNLFSFLCRFFLVNGLHDREKNVRNED